MAAFLFWAGIAFLAYTFGGYALAMKMLARIAPARTKREGGTPPEVCILLVAHNEAGRIAARIENLIAAGTGAGLRRIVVVSDGSTDNTAAVARAACGPYGVVLDVPERRGKAAGINEGIDMCNAPIVVFADARQRFATDAIARLAEAFLDPRVGAVSGALEIETSASSAGAGMDAYWRMEKALRADEARHDSSIGCTGAIYAIRRELFVPLPADTILDDVVTPMNVALGGHRVLFDPAAKAFDPQTLDPASEKQRKVRTLAGNFQMLARYPAWLSPARNRLWWQLISHKYLRLLAPVALAVVFLANGALAFDSLFYGLAYLGQCALYAAAIMGLRQPERRNRLLALPAGFVFLNLMTVSAFWNFLTGAASARWQSLRS